MFYVYAVYNATSNKLYIGQTNNLERRVLEHNTNKIHYTGKLQGEWVMIYQESLATRSEALRREKALKSYRGREYLKSFVPS